jgi:hypothetical protein
MKLAPSTAPLGFSKNTPPAHDCTHTPSSAYTGMRSGRGCHIQDVSLNENTGIRLSVAAVWVWEAVAHISADRLHALPPNQVLCGEQERPCLFHCGGVRPRTPERLKGQSRLGDEGAGSPTRRCTRCRSSRARAPHVRPRRRCRAAPRTPWGSCSCWGSCSWCACCSRGPTPRGRHGCRGTAGHVRIASLVKVSPP